MEYLSLSDFDKRYFPPISEDEKIQFILHSNSFERISLTPESIKKSMINQKAADPAVAGQMRLIHYAEILAADPELFPQPNKITPYNFNTLFPWFTKLHTNLFIDFSRKGKELDNTLDYPQEHELGIYRTEEKYLGNRKMPPPHSIPHHLAQTFKNFSNTLCQYKEGIDNPRLLETKDWIIIEKAAYHLNLSISCIKPFNDGSNRIGRITENIARLNVGLKFKIIKEHSTLLKDIWEFQDSHFKSHSVE
jgi:Fic family protein